LTALQQQQQPRCIGGTTFDDDGDDLAAKPDIHSDQPL